jgi:predicted DCC family thiol-disulfide oxidoreductase YuxK
MNIENIKNNIWFVYDGDCPLCTNAALALKIKRNMVC